MMCGWCKLAGQLIANGENEAAKEAHKRCHHIQTCTCAHREGSCLNLQRMAQTQTMERDRGQA